MVVFFLMLPQQERNKINNNPSYNMRLSLTIVTLCLVATTMFVDARDAAGAPRRIIAVGDVHGDLAQLRAVLEMANVINDEAQWIDRDNTVVVQVGDLLDRGPHDKGVLDFMMQLQAEAPTHGGKVVSILGNHELMNIMNQVHYVHPESIEYFEGSVNRKRQFSAEGVYGQWIRQNPLLHVEGSTLFVHAGLSPQFAAKGVDALNKEAKEALSQKSLRHLDRSALFGVHGPIWTRLLITDAMNGRCKDVEESLSLLPGIERMVVGHTPQRSGRVETYCDDKLIAVDVGLSKWMYGNLAALEITQKVDGSVELREIIPHNVATPPAAPPAIETEGDNHDAKQGSGIEGGVSDPILLQELMEAIQEMKVKQQAEKAALASKEQQEVVARDEL